MSQHTFVISDALAFTHESEGTILQQGKVFCQKNVMLEVEKWFEARYFGQTLRVRCYMYTYIGWLAGERLLLKYHNLHTDPDDYIHRVYDPATGDQALYETLKRYQFPTFTEVLDELEFLSQAL